MIRFCPSCHTERPVTEFFCQGEVNGQLCNWDIAAEQLHPSGWRPESVVVAPIHIAETATTVQALVCINGHPMAADDPLCFECGATAAPIDESAAKQTIIDGWLFIEQISHSQGKRERYLVEHQTTQQRAILTLYDANAEPDPAIYDVLKRLPHEYVPDILATGRWNDRAYEVIEYLAGRTLADLAPALTDIAQLKPVLRELAEALHAFNEAGLRHRDLRPNSLLVRTSEPLDLVISGFGSARLSEFDLDIVSPLEISYYSAPEVIAGGVAAASDWWSLGMILLEQITHGACFAGVNQQAFLIHLLANGVDIPCDIPLELQHLLRGLLARDRLQRWQWPQVQQWLAGQWVELPQEAITQNTAQGSFIQLAEQKYYQPNLFALAAAETEHWQSALELLEHGAIATWLKELQFPSTSYELLQEIAQDAQLPADFKLTLSLPLLNPQLPLVYQGQIITPTWLLEHPQQGYALISEDVPHYLIQIDSNHWLLQLQQREYKVRQRAEQLNIQLNEAQLRIYLLCTSKAQLHAQWLERLRFMPDSEHTGIQTLADRPLITEEDLIVLLSADIAQFRTKEAILNQAQNLALNIDLLTFESTQASELLNLSRTNLYNLLEQRTSGFAYCGLAQIDAWVEQFRLEKRLDLIALLLVLSIPEEQWLAPEEFQFFSQTINFFQRKLVTSVLRGPLARMRISENSARIDLHELNHAAGTDKDYANTLLQHLLLRNKRKQSLQLTLNLHSRLYRLVRESNLYYRDTGIDGLYLGFPFLIQPVRSAQPRIFPLLLWPIKIDIDTVGQLAYVAFDDARAEIRINPALDTLLGSQQAELWSNLCEQLLRRSALTTEEIIEFLASLVPIYNKHLAALPQTQNEPVTQIQLVCSAVLFHMTYLGQAIGQDLQRLQRLTPSQTSLETLLRLNTDKHITAKTESHSNQSFFITASDPSQEQAVRQAEEHLGVLIEGPPGTGKSQTIVNIVANAIGKGKSLLIVCQKRAALDVVYKRLVAEGLEQRLVMINDVNADRTHIVRDIRMQLEALQAHIFDKNIAIEREQLATHIQLIEQSLDNHQTNLLTLNEHLGMSYRDILCALINLEEKTYINAPALRSLFQTLTLNDVLKLEQDCSALAPLWLAARYENSPLEHCLNFATDNATLELFEQDWNVLKQQEIEREQLLKTSAAFDIQNAPNYRVWQQQYATILLALSAQERSLLALVLPLFKEYGQGQHYLTQIQHLTTEANALKLYHHSNEWAQTLHETPIKSLLQLTKASRHLANNNSTLRYLNPAYWYHKHILSGWLLSQQQNYNHELIIALTTETQLAQQWRQIQHGLDALQRQLGINSDTTNNRLTVLNQLQQLTQCLTFAQQIATSLNTLDNHQTLYQALMDNNKEVLICYFEQLEIAYQRYQARINSANALNHLSRWLHPDFIQQYVAAIKQNKSFASIFNAFDREIDNIVSFQNYRLRAQKLSAQQHQVFALLRLEETQLLAITQEHLTTVVRNTLYREAYLAWKTALEQTTPELLQTEQEAQEKIAQLAELDQELLQLNQHYLQQVDPENIQPLRQWEDITRLTGVRAKRLREFIELGIPLGLLQLRPIWLINPDIVSRVLPLTAQLFDQVIFDEASQMPIEYALPALYRAQTVVVSGDEKQMPPSSFFSGQIENEEEILIEDNESLPDEEQAFRNNLAWNQREIKDCPDLLQLARSVLPVSTLQIHYRSRYRELINYSNAAFYGNQLSIPVRHPMSTIYAHKPIELISIQGCYENQSNLAEAKAIVAYLADYWQQKAQTPSIGIVTFNRKQADLIEAEIQYFAQINADFQQRLALEMQRIDNNEDMSLFVKNVENVQGDERDIILFSTTFGPNKQGSFRRNFGVLGQLGGERRLNVAITRAKQKVMLFSSMPIAQISDMLSTARAPQTPRDYLQGYLSYAEQLTHQHLEQSTALLNRVQKQRSTFAVHNQHHDQFLDLVERYIRSLGYPVTRQTDAQDVFSVDFAIEDPKTGLYAIAIDCDAPYSPLLQKARAREIWRPQLLKRSVQHLHQVSSVGWYKAPFLEQEKLRQAIENAIDINIFIPKEAKL